MRMQKMLHILRNPYGWSENKQREARLAAAAEIERLSREATGEGITMKFSASVGSGAKKSDSIDTRVGKLTLTAQLAHLPFDEHRWLARLFRQIRSKGVEGVVEAAERAEDE